MKTEIICVGTELLVGDIVNTNAQYISAKLTNIGIDLYYQTTVGDNYGRLMECLENAFKRVDLVITTGGLGPTIDDITKEKTKEQEHIKKLDKPQRKDPLAREEVSCRNLINAKEKIKEQEYIKR